MFLKSLTLKGFKSFAEPTTLDLEPGVTVVVGPNGSGKSNVVDALAWVLGAQAPRSVRSQKMDDVIFAGTATRPALGRAEVTITIDNSDGTLGIEFTEVTITRILFRTGESEYAINGVSCRLLDVQELLSDAGVGRQQHVIVSQGQIDAVLNARPEERRAIIEEAAGVLKFRRRKEKAERRLDATEANLLRVQDLLREVRRQLRPLERQAKAAERHAELIDEVTSLRTFVAGREIAGLRSTLEQLASTRHATASDESRLKSLLAALDTSIIGLEAELSAQGASDVGDRLRRVEQLRERARGLSLVIAERRRSIERDRGQLLDAGVVANLEGDAATARRELDEVAAEQASIEPELARMADDEATLAEDALVVESDPDPSAEIAPMRAATAAAEVRGELRSSRAALQRSRDELERTVVRAAAYVERLTAAERLAEQLRAELAAAAVDEVELVAQQELLESAAASAARAVEDARIAHARCSDDVARWSARADALELALDAARARAGAERLAAVDGVLGTLLELIEIDPGWEVAVEAALGESVTAVVVAHPDVARRAVDVLRSDATSGAVLALGVRHAPSVRTTVGDPVRPHVRSGRPGVSGLLDVLLDGTVRIDEVGDAVDAALHHPDHIVVTAAGDRFGPSGWRVGVPGGGATAAALDDARSQLAASTSASAAAADELTRAEAIHERCQRECAELSRRLDDHDARFTAATDGLAQARGEQRELRAELDSLDVARADIEQAIEHEGAHVAELDALLPALEGDEAAEADAVRERERRRRELDARASLLMARRRDVDIRIAALTERRASLERRIAEIDARLAANDAARAAAEGRRVEVERSLATLDELDDRVRSRRDEIERCHGALSDLRRAQSDSVRSLSGQLDGSRRERHDAERDLEAVRERSRRAELDEAEAKLRLENTIETLRRELDIEPAAAESAPLPELPEGASPAGRLRELDREVRLLGPINPLALEEFNELQTRHQFLEAQLDDVRTTRRELGRVIAAIDAEIQVVFAAAFADVSANFAHLFTMLFPGGKGTLTLTDPDDLLRTGIEVEAKPSGKNVKKLSLLSGGERSLTALAYLFAVFRSRPSPFYVMDEVEAALDDVNLHRFLGLVGEFRKDAQLIIVSHQKRTMEAGDSLLGVSMQPGGSSRVVTERVAASA